MKTDRKQQALNAFKNASEMAFDAKIQEDAYLNYAKLSYEIGNSYQSIPGVLKWIYREIPKQSEQARNRNAFDQFLYYFKKL